jgi:F-type H+-transporting ATPase subunit b
MNIDFWGLALQAINALILVWLLSRVFWRPVSRVIVQRQENAKALIQTARDTQAKADAVMAEVTQSRAGIDDERRAALVTARAAADEAANALLSEARARADTLLAAAQATIDKDSKAARKANAAQATDLSLTIATKLLRQLDGPEVQRAFLSRLVDAISNLSPTDLAALEADPDGIQIVTASDPAAGCSTIEQALRAALGEHADLHFVTDPDLIAGAELHSAHVVLRNSWQADLTQIRKVVQNAA